jgi:hypothetical protein
MNHTFRNNKITQTEYSQNTERKDNNSINSIYDMKRTYTRPVFQRNKQYFLNQNNKCTTKGLTIENSKNNNNNDSYVNYLYTTENNSQIFNSSKPDYLKEKININNSRINESNNNSNGNNKTMNIIESNYLKNLKKENSKCSLNKEEDNFNKTITKKDYLNIIEKLSNVVDQLEDYQKEIENLKIENNHLRKILLNTENINKNNINNLTENESNKHLKQIELLFQQLNFLKNEYENYKKINEKRYNNIRSKSQEYFNNKILKLQNENNKIKRENKVLKQKFENSDMDYVKLLKRNENLNKEIFKLKNYIDNKINIIIPFSISNFSFEINTNKFKIVKPLFKKSSLSKRINSVLIPKKNQKLNNNYNNDNPEYIISTIETENNSLINKVQKLEDQLRNYLKNKIGKKRSLEQLRSYSQK